MSINWGWKIALLYIGFVTLILSLVVASSHQHFDLVSKNYYQDEISYQQVIDAGKNQSGLSAPMGIHAGKQTVEIDFPPEFKNKVISGEVHFYSALDARWDHSFKINAQNNSFSISRQALHDTRYTVKINCIEDEKNYYQESEIILHP
jgi:hypothetical protein